MVGVDVGTTAAVAVVVAGRVAEVGGGGGGLASTACMDCDGALTVSLTGIDTVGRLVVVVVEVEAEAALLVGTSTSLPVLCRRSTSPPSISGVTLLMIADWREMPRVVILGATLTGRAVTVGHARVVVVVVVVEEVVVGVVVGGGVGVGGLSDVGDSKLMAIVNTRQRTSERMREAHCTYLVAFLVIGAEGC